MKPVKNKKRIDPRYFLDETMIKEQASPEFRQDDEFRGALQAIGDDPGLTKSLAKGTWERGGGDVDKLAQKLFDLDFPAPSEGEPEWLWDAYVQTAKEILMGHPALEEHRGPVIKALGYDPREDT